MQYTTTDYEFYLHDNKTKEEPLAEVLTQPTLKRESRNVFRDSLWGDQYKMSITARRVITLLNTADIGEEISIVSPVLVTWILLRAPSNRHK